MTAPYDPEFDHVFTVTDDGRVIDGPSGVYAPSVWHDDDDDIVIDGPGWAALTGRTGQYGYHGAVLHASEMFAGSLYSYVLDSPGTYVLTVVEVLPDEDDSDPEPAGWTILRRDDVTA